MDAIAEMMRVTVLNKYSFGLQTTVKKRNNVKSWTISPTKNSFSITKLSKDCTDI